MQKFKTNFKSFLSATKYEFIRISRNKILLALLVVLSIVMMLLISKSDLGSNISIAFYANGSDLNDIKIVEIIDEYFEDSNNIIVSSEEEGIELVQKSKARLFISINTTQETESATIYYDSANSVSNQVIGGITSQQNELSFIGLKDFLAEYGIEIKEEYFQSMKFSPVAESQPSGSQSAFANALTITISIIIMFGISYSISRDNETNISRNLSYLPISTHKYILSKLTPYILIAIFEILFILLIGLWIFKINYAINLFIILLLSILFVLASATLGLLTSLCSSQITATILQIATIIMPTYILSVTFFENSPIVFRELMYLMPSAHFTNFLNTMMFNGVVLWTTVILFVVQIITYYTISFLIIQKKSRQ